VLLTFRRENERKTFHRRGIRQDDIKSGT